LSIDADINRLFPSINSHRFNSIDGIRHELSAIFRLLPNGILNSIDCRSLIDISIDTLEVIYRVFFWAFSQVFKDTIDRSNQSFEQIFGNVREIDIRGCIVDVDRFKEFGVMLPRLSVLRMSLISVDYFTTLLGSVELTSEDEQMVQIAIRNRNWLKKSKQLEMDRIGLLAILMRTFPDLELIIATIDM